MHVPEKTKLAVPQHLVIDRQNLPVELQRCDWRLMNVERSWGDGELILVAVPPKRENLKGPFRYVICVVTIRCDEDFFSVEEADEPWGWDLSDVDFWLPLYPA